MKSYLVLKILFCAIRTTHWLALAIKLRYGTKSLFYYNKNTFNYLALAGLYEISYFSGMGFCWFITGDVSHETFTDVGLINVKVMFSGVIGAESVEWEKEGRKIIILVFYVFHPITNKIFLPEWNFYKFSML